MMTCQNLQPPTALGELSVDGNCHTTNVLSSNTVDDISLLPGNYRAMCHSNGTMLHFFASGCQNDHCGSNSQLVHAATNSTDHCEMNTSSPSSLYARTDPPEYPIQKLEDASASGTFTCMYLNSDIDNVNVTFVIFGDCSDPECPPLEASSSSVVPVAIIPTPSPSYSATTIIMPTSRSTKDPQQHMTAEAPTTASIVITTTTSPTIATNHNNNNNPHNNPLSETASSSSSASSTNHIGRIVAISLGMMSVFVAYALLLYYRGRRDGRRQHHQPPPSDHHTDIMTPTTAAPVDYVIQHIPPPSQPNGIVPSSSSSSSLYSSSTNLSRMAMTSASAATHRFSNLRIRGTDMGGGGGSSSMNSRNRMMVPKPSPDHTTDVGLPDGTIFHDIPSWTINRRHSHSTQRSDGNME